MYESKLHESKLSIFPGNVLKVSADLLVLHEVSNYSHTYNRIIKNSSVKESKIDEKQGVILRLLRSPKLMFKRVLVVDSISNNKQTSFPIMEEIVKWIIAQLPDPKEIPELPKPGYTISFCLTHTQETSNLKSLVDKFISIRPVHAILVGMPSDVSQMLTYLNNSGPFLSNSSINTPDLLQSLFNKLSCDYCKRLYQEIRCNENFTKIYCKLCAAMNSAHQNNKYFQSVIQGLKETCYCGKGYLLKDKESHMSECPTTVFCCEKCQYFGGQLEFAYHFVDKHPKELVDNMKSMLQKRMNQNFKQQCQACGTFHDMNKPCGECYVKELKAKRAIS